LKEDSTTWNYDVSKDTYYIHFYLQWLSYVTQTAERERTDVFRKLIGKQDRQCTYNVTLRGVRATFVPVEKQ